MQATGMDAGGTRSMSWKLTWRNDGPRARNAPARRSFSRAAAAASVPSPSLPGPGWVPGRGRVQLVQRRTSSAGATHRIRRGAAVAATGGLAMSRASLAIRQGPTLPITLSSGAGNGTVATGRKATGPSGS